MTLYELLQKFACIKSATTEFDDDNTEVKIVSTDGVRIDIQSVTITTDIDLSSGNSVAKVTVNVVSI